MQLVETKVFGVNLSKLIQCFTVSNARFIDLEHILVTPMGMYSNFYYLSPSESYPRCYIKGDASENVIYTIIISVLFNYLPKYGHSIYFVCLH